MNNDQTNVTTGEVRLSYVHLFKPYAMKQGQEEKYSCTILVPKTDTATMGRIYAAIEAAKQKGIRDKWGGTCPAFVPTPVYDGDGARPSDGEAFGPECKGHWVFTARASIDYPPEVVDAQGGPILNQSEIYSGIYAYVNVTFFPYASSGKKGIGCSLGPVMKHRDGEPLSGGTITAAKAFGQLQAQTPQTGQSGNVQSTYPLTGQSGGVQSTYPITGRSGGVQPVNPITGQPY